SLLLPGWLVRTMIAAVLTVGGIMVSRWLILAGAAFLVVLPTSTPNAAQHPTPGAQKATRSYRSPLGLAVGGDGARAYAALHRAGAIAVVDVRAGKVVHEISVGNGPYDIALTQRHVFVSCEHDDTLVRIDRNTHAITDRWRVGQAPRGVAVLPDGSR